MIERWSSLWPGCRYAWSSRVSNRPSGCSAGRWRASFQRSSTGARTSLATPFPWRTGWGMGSTCLVSWPRPAQPRPCARGVCSGQSRWI